jgi:hypothetical protein
MTQLAAVISPASVIIKAFITLEVVANLVNVSIYCTIFDFKNK